MHPKPQQKPSNPSFSSGPAAKRPGWSLEALSGAILGRSHRGSGPARRLAESIDLTREILQIPDDYAIGIFPGSDTGAFETALWCLLGPRDIDVLAWESFGQGWAYDINEQLKLGARVLQAPYGEIPDLGRTDWDRDVVFVWNGTTSGAKVPDGDWIPDDRRGLSICDGTSAAFAMEMPWPKVDVFTFSWQKCLGSEGAHGMLVLSPKAIERIESFQPDRPLPKLFWRLWSKGKLNAPVFRGHTISTPSMLCVEDYIDALKWSRSVGGLRGLIARTEANFRAIEQWLADDDRLDFLTRDPACRSTTSVCVKITDPEFLALDPQEQDRRIKALRALLEQEDAAYDIGAYHAAPPSLRIWCGPTVEADDVALCGQWISWAYDFTCAAPTPQKPPTSR